MSPKPRHVLLAVCGGIAAYKACEVLRGLQKAGCEVRVTMTADAERFVGPATFEGLTRHAVADDLYGYPETAIPHVDLAEWADLVVVVPATANVMAKMAAGLADDCLSTTLLAVACPVLVAPGMNVHMWQNAATQANLRTLRARGVSFVLPVEGHLACGDVGAGKLADVEDIVSAALAALDAPRAEKDLQLTRILVTEGPTHEAIDPVRYIANASTGKMGYAIAEAAASALMLRTRLGSSSSIAIEETTGMRPDSRRSRTAPGSTPEMSPTRPKSTSPPAASTPRRLFALKSAPSSPEMPTARLSRLFRRETSRRWTWPVRTILTISIASGVVTRTPSLKGVSIPSLDSIALTCGPPPWTTTGNIPTCWRNCTSAAKASCASGSVIA